MNYFTTPSSFEVMTLPLLILIEPLLPWTYNSQCCCFINSTVSQRCSVSAVVLKAARLQPCLHMHPNSFRSPDQQERGEDSGESLGEPLWEMQEGAGQEIWGVLEQHGKAVMQQLKRSRFLGRSTRSGSHPME